MFNEIKQYSIKTFGQKNFVTLNKKLLWINRISLFSVVGNTCNSVIKFISCGSCSYGTQLHVHVVHEHVHYIDICSYMKNFKISLKCSLTMKTNTHVHRIHNRIKLLVPLINCSKIYNIYVSQNFKKNNFSSTLDEKHHIFRARRRWVILHALNLIHYFN